MQPVQRVLATAQRIEDRLVIERVRHAQVLRVPGGGVDIGEHLVHAAVLGAERRLLLRFGDVVDAKLRPVGHFRHHLERLRIAA